MSEDRKKRLSEKETRTKGISDLIRYISFGLVALTYSIFISKSMFSAELLANHKTILLVTSLCGALAIAFDYLQYLSGYIAVNKALAESDDLYNRQWWSYKFIKLFFVAKQLLAILGVVLVCVAMIRSAIGC